VEKVAFPFWIKAIKGADERQEEKLFEEQTPSAGSLINNRNFY
jgi:hypothetical protein